MEKYMINIANDFSPKLGGRWQRLGSYSGEQFFEDILKPKYQEARDNQEQLHIYMDGASPYGSSFLDQSFGELGRQYGNNDVKKSVIFHTEIYGWIADYICGVLWA